ncbi:NAD(P)-binding domain-containing protein [candidate division KSB1 bacterium]|nr:NAD(P)-binding domain-containing protein [candidate division KSB1 bacterium]NIR70977.1 NAD(P)-binding domain-containing protein [candidate division KSB1 bacterium]NIS24718.1 NAD(P)-binding domain-containing protein [candidate division KSB1 bacterium]NIT71622.1 NAD(P)-binding domain-containing protein [candidate division KSB1 bacterium]NIU25329.1 NAD(P)-binding domain-containing protein [candidate division KSB1 bacterium]
MLSLVQSAAQSTQQFISNLFDDNFDPAKVKLPEVNDKHESNISGLYIIGEVSGTPLIKLGLNQGNGLINDLFENKSPLNLPDDVHDVLIVGAGASGIGAANRAHELGLDYVVIEQGKPANLIRSFTKGKPLFMEPTDVPLESSMWCKECSKEELLEVWDRRIAERGLNINPHESVTDIKKLSDYFVVTTSRGTYQAKYVILAIGKAGNPRKAGVPGEKEYAEKVAHFLADPDEFRDQDILIYGGGDVAAEAAIALAPHNRVTMVTIDPEFIFPKKRNVDKLRELEKQGQLSIHFNSHLKEIGKDFVKFEKDKNITTLKNDQIFEMIGAELPIKFFDKIGIKLEGTWDVKKYLALAAMFLIAYCVYAIKAPWWPFNQALFTHAAGNAVNLKKLLTFDWNIFGFAKHISPSFWYAAVYTVFMTYFGYKAYLRWGINYKDPYQKKRYITLIGTQWSLGFLVPEFIMWYVHYSAGSNIILGSPEYSWKAYGLEYIWPLQFHQFFYDISLFYIIWGLVTAFVVIPILSIHHGKRYCTWFCGCGGLAETWGDRWRHKAPKGRRAKAWEWMNVAVLVWAFVATILVGGSMLFGKLLHDDIYHWFGFLSQAGEFSRHWYAYIADFWLVGVIPITLYPFFGGKVWCRYWCPLAKWMEFWSKKIGKLGINSNEKCITCGECSRYCEVGIDVMSFAKNQERFSNQNTSCIQCGICITVCPMDVLSFQLDGEVKVNGEAVEQEYIRVAA